MRTVSALIAYHQLQLQWHHVRLSICSIFISSSVPFITAIYILSISVSLPLFLSSCRARFSMVGSSLLCFGCIAALHQCMCDIGVNGWIDQCLPAKWWTTHVCMFRTSRGRWSLLWQCTHLRVFTGELMKKKPKTSMKVAMYWMVFSSFGMMLKLCSV